MAEVLEMQEQFLVRPPGMAEVLEMQEQISSTMASRLNLSAFSTVIRGLGDEIIPDGLI